MATFADIARWIGERPAARGVVVLASDGRERAYLLGPSTQTDASPPVLDWRSAPLAEAFFRAAPGEPYAIDAGDRTLEGTVAARWLVAGSAGRVDALVGDDRALYADGRVERRVRPTPAFVAKPDRALLPTLDPEQQRAVDLPADASLVVDGEAGVGKTLVALYRVAALERRARERGRRFRALVLVPTEGLRRLCKLLAERLAIARLELAVVDDWLVERARRAFPGLPKRTSEGASAQVIALKRHPAVRVVLADFVGWKPPRDPDEKLPRSRARLLHLFGDRDRLQRVLDAAAGALPARAIAESMAHARAQFEVTTERAHRHVDADRLIALDGRALDSGTPAEDAETFDAEDAPVLFELARLGALPRAQLPVYEHVVVDEAQLRAPMELAAIADAVAPGGSVTLAGDHRQATDETAYFAGWAAARAELVGARSQRARSKSIASSAGEAGASWQEVTLAITYRSVPAIADFARAPVAPAEPPDDPAVWASACDGALGQATALCWHLAALVARDPWRQIAVVARTPEHARRLHGELARGVDPLLVLDGDFRFEPGIVVTTAAAVAGLEFDAVVVPDLSPAFYPATPELARALYVAITRARDWLWLLTTEAWSPLLHPRRV
jgi:hypothetical protein